MTATVFDARSCHLGEGLLWHPERQQLFWFDILENKLMSRNGDTPLPVLAARSPADCFDTAIEATLIALRHMTPVILLTDGYIANASELWPIPDFDTYEAIGTQKPDADATGSAFDRDPETLGRRWATPGDARFMYRVGGIEKDIDSGNISYDADNHQAMTDLRADKVARVANFIPEQTIDQGVAGGLAVVAWGSTYGTVYRAVKDALSDGLDVAHVHLRHIAPLAPNLAELLAGFEHILVPELNNGQLAGWLRAQLGDRLEVPLTQFNKVSGQPFTVKEVKEQIQQLARQRLSSVRA